MKAFVCAARRQSAPGRPNMLGTLIKQCEMTDLRVQRAEKLLPGTAKAGNIGKPYKMKVFARAARQKLASGHPQKLKPMINQYVMKIFARAARRKIAPGRPRKLEFLRKTL